MNHTHCICEFIQNTPVNTFVWRYSINEIISAQNRAGTHSHSPFELICVLSGQGSVKIGSTIERINAGQCLIVTPGRPHRLHCNETGSFTIASLHFNADLKLADCLLDCDSNKAAKKLLDGCGYIKIVGNTSFVDIAIKLITELVNKEKDRDLLIKLLFAELVLAISRFVVNSPALSKDANATTYIAGAKAYIDDNLEQPLTPTSISKALYISASYLMHLSKNHFGMTLMEYVYFRRIEKSRTLLSETPDKITSIARMVGLPNTQYFSVLFKKQTGKTPSEYRRDYNFMLFPKLDQV